MVPLKLTFSDQKDILVRLLEMYSTLIHTDIVRRLPRMQLEAPVSLSAFTWGYSNFFSFSAATPVMRTRWD